MARRSANEIALIIRGQVQLEKHEALRLEQELEASGRNAGREMGRNFSKEFQKQLNIQDAATRHRHTAALNAATKLAELEDKLTSRRQEERVAVVLVTDAEREKARVMEDSTSTVEDQERATRALTDANNNLRRIQSDVITLQHRRIKADRDFMKQSEDVADTMERQNVTLGQSILSMGKYLSAIRAIAIPVGAVAGLSLFTQIASAVGALSKSLILIPGAVTGVVAGMGAMSVATMGFGDALKDVGDPEKFAEGLQKLSPNAQQAALSIQAIMPALSELKNATQDALFADGATMINQLANEYLPAVQGLTVTIADGFNKAFKGIFDLLMSPEGVETVDAILTDIGQAFQNLAPAARPFADALLEITKAGAGVLPEIADAAANAADKFASFIREASESGKLESYLKDGLDAVREFGGAVYELGRIFFATGDDGTNVLAGLRKDIKAVADAMPAIKSALDKVGVGFGKLGEIIDQGRVAFDKLGQTAQAVLDGIVNSIEGAYNGIRTIYNAISPFKDMPEFTIGDTLRDQGLLGGLASSLQPPPTGLLGGGRDYLTPRGASDPTGGLLAGPLGDLVNPDAASAPTPGSAGLPGVPAGGYPLPAPPPDNGSGGGGMQDAFVDPSLWSVDSIPVPGLVLPDAMGANTQIDALAGLAQMFELQTSSGVRNEPGSFHHTGNAGDFAGTPEQMHAFAMYMAQNFGGLIEELIYSDPQGRGDVLIGGGQNVAGTGYYSAGTLAEHRDHVHVAVTDAMAPALMAAMQQAGFGGAAPGGFLQTNPEEIMRLEIRLEEAKADVEERRRKLIRLQQSGVATQEQLLDAEQDLKKAENDYNLTALDLAQARQGKYQELDSSMMGAASRTADSMGQIGAALAQDFGISEGLPGIAKWLTTFLANLAFAPAIGALSAVKATSPVQGGYGMFGMMGANAMASGTYPGMGVPMMGVPGLGVPGMGVPGAAAIGPAPLGGGLGAGLTPGLMTPATPGVGTGPLPGPPGGGMGTGGMGGLPGGAPPRMLTPQMGRAPSPGTGGGFQGFGGSGFGALAMQGIQAGLSGAGMAADLMGAGGAGTLAAQAAQTGIELANRTAGYLGQLGGIAVGGLLETFVPNSSEAGDPSKSWFGRIAAGIAGARPALPNTAGGSAPAQPPQAQQKNGQQGPAGPLVSVGSINNYTPDGGNDLARSIARLSYSSYKSGGPGPR